MFLVLPAFLVSAMFVSGSIFLDQVKADPIIEVSTNGIPPVLNRIAKCESGGKQFESNGQVVHGKKVRGDLGKYQINIIHWGEEAMRLNLNLLKEEDNEKMALYIFENFGTSAWSNSTNCWNKL